MSGKNPLILLLVLPILSACSTLKYEGSTQGFLSDKGGKVVVVPLANATANGSAGTALTESITASLSARKIRWVPAGAEGDLAAMLERAARDDAAFLLTGTVFEFEYKTDLDGDPAVAASATLRSVRTGEVVWQGTSSATGFGMSSLGTASQRVADQLVKRMRRGGFLGW